MFRKEGFLLEQWLMRLPSCKVYSTNDQRTRGKRWKSEPIACRVNAEQVA